MSDPDRDDDLIMAAAAMFHAAAMQQLGKLVNPLTSKAEVDLAQARLTIDILAALRAKTDGKLHPEAAAEVDRLLFQLRMGFLDETRRSQPGEAPESAPPQGEGGASASAPEPRAS